MSRVLVAYATKHGSTKEMAEAIASVLRERGVEVELSSAKGVASLDGVSGVVLAAPLYVGALLKDAGAFLEKHRGSLEKLPVAVFAPGPLRPMDDMAASREELAKALEKWPWLRPASADVFIGAYDPAKLKFPESLVRTLPVSPLKGVPAMDNRDWGAIKAWAAALPEKVGVAAAPTVK